jgi:hypothetical protein
MHEATGNAEGKHMRECQTDSGAPYQPKDVPGDGRDTLQGGKCRDQADGHIQGHRPALFP